MGTTFVGGIVAWICLDPAQMVPPLVALTLYAECNRQNNYAAAIAFVFALLAGGTAYAVREGYM